MFVSIYIDTYKKYPKMVNAIAKYVPLKNKITIQ